jgi:hypothetical protein
MRLPAYLSRSALLLEMYTRDGTPGVCMIAADLYEGIRWVPIAIWIIQGCAAWLLLMLLRALPALLCISAAALGLLSSLQARRGARRRRPAAAAGHAGS